MNDAHTCSQLHQEALSAVNQSEAQRLQQVAARGGSGSGSTA